MQQQANRGYSLIQDSGAYTSSCGYCNNSGGDQSTTHGMHAYRLTVYDYQELLDQGWRRSGKFLYRPNNKTTCCRQYTIRLNVDKFQPTKTHKRLLRKWDHFLAGRLQHGQEYVPMVDSSEQQRQHHAGSGSQCGSKRSRQASNGSTPAAVGTACPSNELGTSAASIRPQQQQQLAGVCPASLMTDVQALLEQAVSGFVQQGRLPPQPLPAVQVIAPPPQKLSKLPAGTVMTTSCAHALAAAVRKCRQQQHRADGSGSGGNSSSSMTGPVVPSGDATQGAAAGACSSADELAQALSAVFNTMAAAAHLSTAVVASAAKGHINFRIEQQQQQQLWQQLPDAQDAPQKAQQQQNVDSSSQTLQQQQQQQPNWQQEQAVGKQQQQQPCSQPATSSQQQQQQQQGQPHCLEVRLVPNQFIQEEYELYRKYQINQHHDAPEDITPARYKNFLVDTPLVPVLPPAAAAAAGQQAPADAVAAAAAAAGMPPCGYGSFHQQYWLDGKLVAVGVVDVLPRCLSSKYFFWHPDYAWLSLGRYGALWEIAWMRRAHAAGAADFQYYYLGYYIHTCPKMAYKAEYTPSELLCPERQVWVKLDEKVMQALDRSPYVVLSDLVGVQPAPNLSVPRPLPQVAVAAAAAASPAGGTSAAAAGAAGLKLQQPGTDTAAAGAGDNIGLQSLGLGAVPQPAGLQVQVAARQQQRQGLDSQLLFLLKQPVRWGSLRESGMLDEEQIASMEQRLLEWRSVVGESAAHLLYATNDLLFVG